MSATQELCVCGYERERHLSAGKCPYRRAFFEPRQEPRMLERGTRVRVRKGTPIVYDTAPEQKRDATGRTQIVEVHWMTHYPDTIYWAGAGGYWKGVRLTDDMEVVS